ncbi:MAG: DNA methyltransferase, partial [Spirochaetota bacterium]
MPPYPIDLDDIKSKVARKIANYYNRRPQIEQPFLNFDDRLPNVKEQINEFGERITRVDGEIPPDLPVRDGEHFLFISYDQTILSHGLHKYPAKFFPELPRWLIKRYSSEGDIVLDPFAGSGTTNVEALLTRRHSVAVDVDPFSRYLTKVKVTPLDPLDLEESSKILLKKILHFRPQFVSPEDIPDFPY